MPLKICCQYGLILKIVKPVLNTVRNKHPITVPLLPSMLVAVVLAALCGLLNGLVITRLSLPPFIVTMAMQSIARGVALVYSGGYPVSALPETATQIARGDVIGIPYTVLIMAKPDMMPLTA